MLLLYNELINYKDKVNYLFTDKLQLLNVEYYWWDNFSKKIYYYIYMFNRKECQFILEKYFYLYSRHNML